VVGFSPNRTCDFNARQRVANLCLNVALPFLMPISPPYTPSIFRSPKANC